MNVTETKLTMRKELDDFDGDDYDEEYNGAIFRIIPIRYYLLTVYRYQ